MSKEAEFLVLREITVKDVNSGEVVSAGTLRDWMRNGVDGDAETAFLAYWVEKEVLVRREAALDEFIEKANLGDSFQTNDATVIKLGKKWDLR